MRRLWPGVIVAFLGLIGSVRADRVDDCLQQEMSQHRIPGLAVLVLHTNQTVKRAAYGFANLELKAPALPETVFEIGSVTKQFTAAGILLLNQDGRLSVDDKIATHIPHTPDAWREVTIRHLLTHTSGIKSYTGLDGFELRRHLTQTQFIELIGVHPLEFQAGSAWKYSNSGYNLLGFIIENVTGRSYWDFLSERIFRPLGMNTTTNRLPSLLVDHRAAGYEQTNHVWINRDYDLTDVFSAGAIISTVDDLAKWNNALDRDLILNAASRGLMWAPQRLSDGTMTRYGFGWRLEEVDGRGVIGHGGATSGFSASIQRFPAERLAVIVLSNTDEQIATTLAREVAAFYFGISKKSR